MEFALTFGAVGDFIAVIEIIKIIILVLDDSRGSAKEYRDVVKSLEILEKTLQLVSKFYSDQSSTDDLGDLRAITLRNVEEIRLCLEGFGEKIQKFAPSLANDGGTKNFLKDVARKIQWKLEEKDVDKFRAEVMGYTMSMNTLLEITTARVVQRNHEISIQRASDAENRTAVMISDSNQSLKGYFGIIGRRILTRLNLISRLGTELKSSTAHLISMVLAVSGELSSIKTVIMRLERPLSEEHFILEDATGKVFPIHLRTITSWEAFEYIIVDRFKGRNGARRIQRKRYSLQERATRREVDRSIDWESAFLPYQKVDMSLMCREAQKNALAKSSPTCPRCRMVSPGKADVEVQCQNCGMFFTRVIEVDEEMPPDAPSPPRLNREARFGESAFDTATDARKKRRGDNEEFENEKQRVERESRKSKVANEEPESESDDEDIRGFVRITVISKRRRIHELGLPLHANQTEPFDSMVQQVLGNTSIMSDAASSLDTSSAPSASREAESSLGSISTCTMSQLQGPSCLVISDHSLGGDTDETTLIDSSRDESSKSAESFINESEDPRSETTKASTTDDDSAVSQDVETAQLSSSHTNALSLSSSLKVTKAGTNSNENEESNEDEIFEVNGRTYVLPRARRPRSYYGNTGSRGSTDDYYYHGTYELGRHRRDAFSYEPSRYTARRKNATDHHYATRSGFSYIERDAQAYEPRPHPTANTHARRSSASVPQRPSTTRLASSDTEKPSTARQATEADAKKHKIPSGYSLKNWDPTEEPILLLGSVFDSNSLGKWIYDWTVYHHGPATPISDMAGELWLLLIQLAGKVKRAEEVFDRVCSTENRETIDEFIDSGKRLTNKLRKLLKACELLVLKAARKKGNDTKLGKTAGVEFVETLFGRERELDKTERFLQGVRLFNLRFDANCNDILQNPTQ